MGLLFSKSRAGESQAQWRNYGQIVPSEAGFVICPGGFQAVLCGGSSRKFQGTTWAAARCRLAHPQKNEKVKPPLGRLLFSRPPRWPFVLLLSSLSSLLSLLSASRLQISHGGPGSEQTGESHRHRIHPLRPSTPPRRTSVGRSPNSQFLARSSSTACKVSLANLRPIDQSKSYIRSTAIPSGGDIA